MKRAVTIIVVMTVILSLVACGTSNDQSSKDNAEEIISNFAENDISEEDSTSETNEERMSEEIASEEQNAEESTEETAIDNPEIVKKWIVDAEKDDFGDEVEDGKKYLLTTAEGTFSNSATASSELHVEVALEDAGTANNDIWLYFYLYEYGDNPVSPIPYSNYTMEIKDEDNEIYEFALETVPNSNAIIFMDHGRPYGLHIYRCLCLGQTIKCIIKNASSQYNFSLESGNFVEACEEIGYDVYEDPSSIQDIDTALKLLDEGRQWDYGDRITELLLPLFDELEPMTTEELQEVIKPGHWREDNPAWNMNNVTYVLGEDWTTGGMIKYAWKIEDNQLQHALVSEGKDLSWIGRDVRKIKDGYYLLGRGKVGDRIDMEVLVELDEDNNPLYPIE